MRQLTVLYAVIVARPSAARRNVVREDNREAAGRAQAPVLGASRSRCGASMGQGHGRPARQKPNSERQLSREAVVADFRRLAQLLTR